MKNTFFSLQDSSDSDYNAFSENLVNKRRQIADSNPKNLTHFSGKSMSSTSNIVQSPIKNSSELNPSEIRSTKSIIIGAGNPIIIPGQRSISNENNNNQRHSKSLILSSVANVSKSNIPGSSLKHGASNNDPKVDSVEEFCPDGETLDKNFLDDLPSFSHASASASQSQARLSMGNDSDSDNNESGNPLVAQFHEDPGDFVSQNTLECSEAKTQSNNEHRTITKVNPLAKNKNKNTLSTDFGSVLMRRNSLSSEDSEIPNILKASSDINSTGGLSNVDCDSWLSDTNERRSPEGGEDEATITNIDKNILMASVSITNINMNDDDVNSEKQSKDKSSKKKKKKDKKEKHDKDKKRRSVRSRETKPEELLSESIDSVSAHERNAADDSQYEAI